MWRWALRVFLSTDMVGATALKHEHQDDWPTAVTQFYGDLAKSLPEHARAWSEKVKRRDGHQPRLPELWEVVGDELVFVVEAERLEDVLVAVLALRSTTAAYNVAAAASTTRSARPARGTAWSAGFPVANRVLSVPGAPGNRLQFVGPSIDAGFRLAKAARGRHDLILVSTNLAWLLVQAEKMAYQDRAESELHWQYVGRLELRGVNHGRPVPGFALDTLCGNPTSEDALLRRERKPLDRSDVERVAREHIEGPDGIQYLPFVFADPDSELPGDFAVLERARTVTRSNTVYSDIVSDELIDQGDGDADSPPPEGGAPGTL